FTMLRVVSDKKNANGKPISYDLMPLRYGTSRHKEPFTQHDLFVSRAHPERPLEKIYSNVPNIIKDEETVENADVVLWVGSSSHDEPRDEDGKNVVVPGRREWFWDDGWTGSALVMWSGFDLRPRNLFDRTPFYPYPVTEAVAGQRNRAGEGTDGAEGTRA